MKLSPSRIYPPIPLSVLFRALLVPAMLFTAAYISPVSAAEATIAVAANFLKPLEKLKPVYEQVSGHTLVISSGSTGQLYAQILNGAPYDVMLSADAERPRLLEQEGQGVAGTRFTYAVGRLVLWAPALPAIKTDAVAILEQGQFRALALANPELAPYGMAARQMLVKLQLYDRVKGKIVLGQDIGQTFALVRTGNAELGFVALAQLVDMDLPGAGNRWEIPAGMHAPILQQAILLARASNNPAAREFIDFLRDEAARRIIVAFGYGTE
jgi:molybdate transport system substrate-binding protein